MKRTIKFRVRGPEVVEAIEVEFPYYRRHDVGDEYPSTYYTRIEADGSTFTIQHDDSGGEEIYELSITSPRPKYGDGDLFPWGSGSSLDYELGRGEHALTQKEFETVLAKARAFLARFPESTS